MIVVAVTAGGGEAVGEDLVPDEVRYPFGRSSGGEQAEIVTIGRIVVDESHAAGPPGAVGGLHRHLAQVELLLILEEDDSRRLGLGGPVHDRADRLAARPRGKAGKRLARHFADFISRQGRGGQRRRIRRAPQHDRKQLGLLQGPVEKERKLCHFPAPNKQTR